MPEPRIPNPDVLVGCDALIEVNGVRVAFARSIEMEENLNQRPVEAIGAWKPRGNKSVKWEGRLSMELHVLTTVEDGLIDIDTSSAVAASLPYEINIYKQSSPILVASAVGQVDTRGWSLITNDLSGQRVAFVLYILEYGEGFN